MSRYVFKLPDLGEGTVSAEVVGWHAKVGDWVKEDAPLVEMATDKAVVEVPAPVSGRLVALGAPAGTMLAVGAELAVFDTQATAEQPLEPVAAPSVSTAVVTLAADLVASPRPSLSAARTGRIMASPATRRRAREAGIDLAGVVGSGPQGRIERVDLERHLGAQKPAVPPPPEASIPDDSFEDLPLTGVRRIIAERMTRTLTIPHFSYVEEVDVTALEALRVHLNARLPTGAAPYTYLPFIVLGLVRVLRQFPGCNAHFDAEKNVLRRYSAVHVGIATQAPDGLKVPVVRHAQRLTLRSVCDEIRRVASLTRAGHAKRADLTGSTITVTSLGKLGGIASTPVINTPEVAIIGVNKAVDRPMVVEGAVVVRRMMNLSSSFDHRFVDGYEAAEMIQRLREFLEQPATLFIEP
jgi:2-oxoisovalerate dehydrogenase E2 component (dihydrolipoyl transacylase)